MRTIHNRDLKFLVDTTSHPGQPLDRRKKLVHVVSGTVLAAGLGGWLITGSIASIDPSPGGREPSSSVPVDHHPNLSPQLVSPGAEITALSLPPELKPVGVNAIPDPDAPVLESEPPLEPELPWATTTIKRGDTLAAIFLQNELKPSLAVKIASIEDGQILTRLTPGRELRIRYKADGAFDALQYDLSGVEMLSVTTDGDSFSFRRVERDVEIRHASAVGQIKSSLYKAGAEAGLSDAVVMKIMDIFGWDIDFANGLQVGDTFAVIYEDKFVGDQRIGSGSIVAAEFVQAGRVYRALRHIDENGTQTYYSPDGQSLRQAFLRNPVRYTRITSGFTKRRFNPVLKTWRAHKGVDYAAPRGTPVLATADGTVSFVGRKGGYGKTIILRHGGNYSTLYGHLHRYRDNTKRGMEVGQGEVIGYVGSTGLATGPHLHYEFRVGGIHMDPLQYTPPKTKAIDPKYEDDFQRLSGLWMSRLDAISPRTVALVE